MTPSDPRLIALYDRDNPDGPDHAYFRSLAGEIDARTIVDLGCGTGILTVTLGGDDRRVIGIDPSEGMLDIARRRRGSPLVNWILGDSRAIGDRGADLAVMTGNVAQHICGDDWSRTQRDIRTGLKPGGMLAFETRNPAARAWTGWTKERTLRTRDTECGPLTQWTEFTSMDSSGNAFYTAHYIFERTGEHLRYSRALAFRTAADITHDLDEAGFRVRHIWGDWHRGPVDHDSKVLVFEAHTLKRNSTTSPSAMT